MSNVRSITPNDPANFTPEMGNYKTLQPFRYWCQKVLPLVYDDSLSYYELLCKVVDYLNKAMEDVETLHGDVTNLHTAYDELQSYVNRYFSTLDVQEEINNKLDSMANDGSLYDIFNKYVSPFIESQNQKISVLESRMNEFSSLPPGSTSGDAELADIRIGYNGKTYDTAGDAVREQCSDLSELINYNSETLSEKTKNILDWRTVQLFDGYNDGSKLVSGNNYKTAIIPITVSYPTIYTVKRFNEKSNRFSVALLKDEPENNTVTYKTLQLDDADSLPVILDPEYKYLAIWFCSINQIDNWKLYLKNIVVTERAYSPNVYLPPSENNLTKNVDILNYVTNYMISKNLFNYKNAMLFNGYNKGNSLTVSEQQVSVLIPLNNVSGSFSVSRYCFGSRFSVATIRDVPYEGCPTYGTIQDDTAKNITIAVNTDDKFLVIFIYSNFDTEQHTLNDVLKGLVVIKRYIPSTVYIPYYLIFNSLLNKKINFLGDSFTDDPTSYEYVLTDRLNLSNVHLGKGGSAIVTDVSSADSFITRAENIDIDADITIIFGGINDARDLNNGTISMGNINSPHDKNTFYGGVQLLLDNIIDKIPHQFLLGIIPPSFQPNPPYTTYLPEIQNAEREIYSKYHIPYVDLDKNCLAMSENEKIMELYRKSVVTPTNYHPNANGAIKIADCVQGELEKYIH